MNKHKYTLIAAALTAFAFGASPVLAGKDDGKSKSAQGKSKAAKGAKADGRHDQGLHLGLVQAGMEAW